MPKKTSKSENTNPVFIVDHFSPAAAREKFSPMLQGQGTNRLTQTSIRKTPPAVDSVTGMAVLESGDLTIFFDKYNTETSTLKVSTHKLLDVLTIAVTAQNSFRNKGGLKNVVTIPITEYMKKLDIPQTKPSLDKTRAKLKQDLESLFNISIEWKEKYGTQTKDYIKTRILTSQGIKNGNIIAGFSPEILEYLTNAYVMQYPEQILKISDKNTNAYYFGKKLLLHRSMYANQERGTADILSVRSLLEASPEIPTYEEVSYSDRHFLKRIIEPFERDMNALSEVLTWEYCNAGGEPLSELQLSDFSFAVFFERYIRFKIIYFPDNTC